MNIHFVICGIGKHENDCEGETERTLLALALLQNGVKHVSLLRNGFLGITIPSLLLLFLFVMPDRLFAFHCTCTLFLRIVHE